MLCLDGAAARGSLPIPALRGPPLRTPAVAMESGEGGGSGEGRESRLAGPDSSDDLRARRLRYVAGSIARFGVVMRQSSPPSGDASQARRAVSTNQEPPGAESSPEASSS